MRTIMLTMLATGLLMAGGMFWPDSAEARPRGYYRGRAPVVRYYAPRYAYPRYYAPRNYYYGGPRYYNRGFYNRGYAPGVYFGGPRAGVFLRF